MVDPKDINSLKKFFEDNKYLSVYELSRLADRSPKTIKIWMKKCGMKPTGNDWKGGTKEYTTKFPREPNYKKKLEPPKEKVPREVWDTRDWLYKHYIMEGLGANAISAMTEVSPTRIRQRLRRYNIKVRSLKEAQQSKNPCCTREWVEERYVKKRWSLKKCADAAGITTWGFYKWLIKFNIDIRGPNEALVGKKHNKETRKKISRIVKERHAAARKNKENGSSSSE